MNQTQASELLNLLDQANRSKFVLEDIAFEQQLKFIRDKSRLKALFCTRRAAKSFTGGTYLIEEALKHPGSNCLYIALTRDTAKGIIWKDILRELNTKYDLKAQFNGTSLTMTLPNGSVIWVTGADADEDEMNKLLGKKYRLVVIDEASMFSINMHQLVYGVLKPATADQRGTICLLGTSSNITRGLFYDITTGAEPGWALHKWSAFDNPHVREQWREELEDIKKNRPLFMDTPLFKQWYLNQWVIDQDALVYKYSDINQITELPVFQEQFKFVLGVDLGHSPDPSAFVVSAYHPESPNLYFIHAEKHLRMDVTDVAEKIKELELRWTFEVKVVDNANKQAVAELNNRHGSQLISADKSGKVDFINIMNSEFITQKIFLLPGAKELALEFKSLVWETDNGKIKEPRKEHPGIPNHLTDAALYNWRHAYQYLFQAPSIPLDRSLQRVWEKEHIENLQEQVRREQNPTDLDLHFDDDLFDFSQDIHL